MMENKNNEFIFVVLVSAHTGLGSIARKLFSYEYTHIAVCLEEPLEDFITFSRRSHYAPFDAGFMHETLDCYAFGKHRDVKCKVFRIPVSTHGMGLIKQYIATLEADKDYIFNLYSMATMGIFHGFPIYKAHNCMSFVGKIIELSHSVSLTKPYYKYNILEIDQLLTPFFYQEGTLEKKGTQTPGYMSRFSILKNILCCFSLNGKLLARLWMKRKHKYESNT